MKFFLFLCSIVPAMFCGCSKFETADIPAVKDFDLKRYCGKWYEIARLPNWFERGMTDVSAVYTLLPDGQVKVVNQGVRNGKTISITGRARFAGKSGRGDLEVSFQRPFWSDYRVIYLKEDYSLAAVCGRSRKYLWILSRTPEISNSALEEVLEFISQYGFDISALTFSIKQ